MNCELENLGIFLSSITPNSMSFSQLSIIVSLKSMYSSFNSFLLRVLSKWVYLFAILTLPFMAGTKRDITFNIHTDISIDVMP